MLVQVTRTHIVKVMAQQLSVGLWLMPYAFSKLGWAAASIAMTVSTCARSGLHQASMMGV